MESKPVQHILEGMPGSDSRQAAPRHTQHSVLECLHGVHHTHDGYRDPDHRDQVPWRSAEKFHPFRTKETWNAWQSGMGPLVVSRTQGPDLSNQGTREIDLVISSASFACRLHVVNRVQLGMDASDMVDVSQRTNMIHLQSQHQSVKTQEIPRLATYRHADSNARIQIEAKVAEAAEWTSERAAGMTSQRLIDLNTRSDKF